MALPSPARSLLILLPALSLAFLVRGDPAPVTSGLPGRWAYANCYIDNANGRAFETRLTDDPALTVNSCVNKCNAQGFTLAGMEFGQECYCGNRLVNGAAVGTGCTMACAGNAAQACGAGNRLSVYTSTGNVTVVPIPTIQKTGLPGSWSYTGCVREAAANRVLPYMNEWVTNNTVTACLNQCAKFGYPAAGLEYGQECWCGDVENLTGNGGVIGADSECTMACSGDATHICGGPSRLTFYSWSGLNTWNRPANTGRYEFLIGGLIVPLVATLGLNNKITFVEKFGTSPLKNSTGAYELDLSLVSDNRRAWREMHVKTDVFCSASMILPDKAARQINVGGWSADSLQGIRLYTPSGSAGVNGTTDWEENFNILKLQRPRWYPSTVLLTNGSILVVGGEVGSNGIAEPSLEILPTPPGGPTFLNMDWLQRTDPYNLYPYLFILPSQRVFVGYYNEARILDQRTFATLVTLPNMPGNVNNFLAGRTYPMEGAAVMLPQTAPYNTPVEILVCGGATPVEATALDNCVRIAPEASGPSWVIERMPSQRVMPCMAALPDGTFLIVNGAHHGHAGFGLASDPNFNALLYDPARPSGQRFSILANTNIARLYHSEATLLADGRVLISGSDPNPDPPYVYPEELRLEVYLPPYLTSGARQPVFTLGASDWSYGGTYTITGVQVFQGAVTSARVSLIAATSSTHGAIMGGRTLFPATVCAGTICTITAPPNVGICPAGWFLLFLLDGPTPSVGKWVRIGGDPGQLGNWPNLPGFSRPGL